MVEAFAIEVAGAPNASAMTIADMIFDLWDMRIAPGKRSWRGDAVRDTVDHITCDQHRLSLI
ncbi:MAG TPA: hypothetical protein VFU02_22810 [Polyangiaceae bacterium]|nr:hypothetical protein [Polyangiaceae bacterium]